MTMAMSDPRDIEPDDAPDWEDHAPLRFGDYDRHLFDDDPIDMVRCPRCRKRIPAHARHCRYCEAIFRGEAWQEPQFPVARAVLIILLILCITGLIVLMT